MKTNTVASLLLLALAPMMALGNNPQHPPCKQTDRDPQSALLSRIEWHSLSKAARNIESLVHQAQPVGTRIWPHAVRDTAGRAGLIIMAERPLLMSMNSDDLEIRQAWVLVAVLSAAKVSSDSPLPLDHLALTDADGARGELWYYDVDMPLARQLYRQLKDRKITLDDAYLAIVNSWRVVTAAQNVASH